MPVLASDRGKIVENHRKQRDDALSLASKAVAGPGYGKVRRGGILTGTLFSTDPPLGLSWKGGVSELRNFPRFFHVFSTIRVTKHKKTPCFIVYEKWRFELKNGGGSGDRTHDLLFRREPLYPTELRHRSHVFPSRGMRKQHSDERPKTKLRRIIIL